MLALAGGVLLGAGLSAIHATLNLLFGLGLSSRWLERIWTVSLGFVAPVSFLAFAPRRFNDKITEREEQDFTMRAAAALVKFVLVPLLLVYTAILYAYAVKIALAWELPKGTLAAMVVAYLFVGAVTLLLGFPSRDEGGPLLRFFWRHWVLLVALPVVLLFIAVSRRIADYGLTEERYMIVLVGVWALILAGIRIAKGPDFDLRLLPGVLALLLFAASFGPGGAIGFSVMSQKAELASILAAKNMLADGKFVPAPPGEKDPLGQDAARVRAIEWYLNAHRSLAVLAPWFEGQKDDPFAPGKTPEEAVRELLAAFGLTPTLGGGAQPRFQSPRRHARDREPRSDGANDRPGRLSDRPEASANSGANGCRRRIWSGRSRTRRQRGRGPHGGRRAVELRPRRGGTGNRKPEVVAS